MLKIKNTLSGKIEEFKPIKKGIFNKGKVGLYSCGPTVYNKAHIGNLRAYVFSELIKNTLIFNGYKVKHVINITDVGHLTSDADDGDDKVEEQAKKENKKAEELTEKYTSLFFDDLRRLNIETKDIIFPKATENITEQIKIIKKLEEKGFTYKISDGVYFDTSKFKDYGKLGNIDIEGLEEGSRVEINKEKKNSSDFALWKFSGETKRQQEWDSPWGVGFPGWHLECSAMSIKYLGKTFDIHTGGVDHINTHHNNEIAQSENFTGETFVKYWMHVNHIQINSEKISKSLGNVIYLDDLEKKGFSPMSYKMFLYNAHYSTLLNFTEESLTASQKGLYKIYRFLKEIDSQQSTVNSQYLEIFRDSINDNLNTAKAVATIFELLSDDSINDADKKATILEFDKVLNLGFHNPVIIEVEIPKEIIRLAEQRMEYRKNKDFEKSDELRDKIKELGFEIKDIGDTFEIDKI